MILAAALAFAIVGAALATYDSTKNSAQPRCGFYRTDKTVSIGSTQLKAEVVKTSADLQKGLSGRPCIESNQAMLFDFGSPGQYAIWMKDMHFPIDIIWVDTSQKVVKIEVGVLPSSYPKTFASEQPAQYVLEMQANLSQTLNVNLGTSVDF